MFKNKTVESVFKYFGYDLNKNFKSDKEKAEVRDKAIKNMELSGLVPDEVINKVKTYNDEQIKREQQEKERREAERRRLAQIRATKERNREDDVYADDEHALAVYQHLVDEGEVEEVDDSELNDLKEELKDKQTKLQRLKDSGSSEQRVLDLIDKLEIRIDALESEIDETEEELYENDIYGVLYEQNWTHYGLREFETPHGDYAVGTEEESEDAAKEYMTNYIDENGVDGFSSWVVENNLDTDRLKSDIKDGLLEYYEDMIREDLEDYFEDYDEDDEETHPSDSDIEEKAEEMAEDRADDMVEYKGELEDYGYDINDYLDIEGIVEDVINADGIGHTLSMYDGNEHNIRINDTWYNVYRTN
jgi:hypothetical protein